MVRLAWFLVILLSFFGGYFGVQGNRTAGMLLFVVPVVAFIIWTVRRAQRGARENNRAISLMSEGRYVEAIAAFEIAAGLMPRSPLPGYNAGSASIWLWRLDDARTRIEKSTTTFAGRPIRIMAVPSLAFIAAVQNDRSRAEALDKEIETLNLTHGPMVLLARAVWFARDEKWREVMDALDFNRIRALGGPSRAVADALRAWAMVKTGQPLPPIDRVGVFGETGPEALKKWWPEFTLFLESTA
jgi:hypothetical protein